MVQVHLTFIDVFQFKKKKKLIQCENEYNLCHFNKVLNDFFVIYDISVCKIYVLKYLVF